jgi:hypothetical protein
MGTIQSIKQYCLLGAIIILSIHTMQINKPTNNQTQYVENDKNFSILTYSADHDFPFDQYNRSGFCIVHP